jgi:hypothetical protein
MTSLLKKKNPRLGGSTNVLSESHFSFQKMVQDEQILSSSKSGLRFLTDRHFPIQKMVQIVDVP